MSNQEKPFYKNEFEKKNVQAFTPGATTVMKKKQTPNFSRVESNDEEGNFQVQKVPRETQIKIQQGRASKGWNQSKLALMCALPEYVIKSYENGSAVLKKQELDKILRALDKN